MSARKVKRTVGKAVKGAVRLVKDKRTSSTKRYSSDRPGIDPQKWAKLAGLKRGWKELDLQRYIAQRLRESGYVVKENVEIKHQKGGWCEADIVLYKDGNPWQVLEVKPYLNRSKVIEGTTQARAYTNLLGCSVQPILIGLAPYSDREYWGGRNAINTTAHNNVEIVYLNEDQHWTPSKDEGSFWEKIGIKLDEIPWKHKTIILLLFFLWTAVGSWEFTSRVRSQPQQPTCKPCPTQSLKTSQF